jgi:hypothetical protein
MQELKCLSHNSSLFFFAYFGDRVSLSAQVAYQSSYFRLPAAAGMTGMHHHAQLLVEVGSC